MSTAPVHTIRGQINSRYEMLRAGYQFSGHAKCKQCGAPVEWWLTNNGRKVCLNPISHDEALTEAHRRTCDKAPAAGAPGPDQTESSYHQTGHAADALAAMQREVKVLCAKYRLRSAILIHQNGCVHSYLLGIPPEDLRNEIITAANKVRDDAMKGGR